jgi:hypothetical protein
LFCLIIEDLALDLAFVFLVILSSGLILWITEKFNWKNHETIVWCQKRIDTSVKSFLWTTTFCVILIIGFFIVHFFIVEKIENDKLRGSFEHLEEQIIRLFSTKVIKINLVFAVFYITLLWIFTKSIERKI